MVNQRPATSHGICRDSAALRGTAASRGRATGRARVLHRQDQRLTLYPGDIVICTIATPECAPMFARASGVVAETGGVLSNAATVAREYGIPAVVGVADATSRIRDGQVVTIDGAGGVVILHG